MKQYDYYKFYYLSDVYEDDTPELVEGWKTSSYKEAKREITTSELKSGIVIGYLSDGTYKTLFDNTDE